jgi:hypothetical protein
MAKSTATYLYCVVKSVRRPPAPSATGLAGASPAQAYEAGRGLWLIAAEVPLDEYGPGRLEPRLQNLDWVAAAAVAHEAVVEHFSRRSTVTVIPAKLFTMFSSVEKAIADVSRRRASLDRVIKRIAGCEEWGVRITRRPGLVTDRSDDSGSSPASGTAFLTARKAARDAVSDARAAAAAAADEAFRALASRARDARSRERRPEPGSNPPILEGAFLVTTSARAKFKSEARRQSAACQGAGADLTLTGPWPAYNFVGDPT